MVVRTARVGAEAAVHEANYITHWWVPFIGLASVPFVIAGAYSHLPPVWIIGIVILVSEIPFLALVGWHIHEAARLASLTLGVKVRWGYPPADRDKYIAWCKDNGLVPFQAADLRPRPPGPDWPRPYARGTGRSRPGSGSPPGDSAGSS